MELDLKKVFYVIVAIGMIGVMALCLVQPISKKIQEQKTQIDLGQITLAASRYATTDIAMDKAEGMVTKVNIKRAVETK